VKTVRLYEKIAMLRQRMRALEQIKQQLIRSIILLSSTR
jgi:hypothetical protein